jgi:hypothetical protein
LPIFSTILIVVLLTFWLPKRNNPTYPSNPSN